MWPLRWYREKGVHKSFLAPNGLDCHSLGMTSEIRPEKFWHTELKGTDACIFSSFSHCYLLLSYHTLQEHLYLHQVDSIWGGYLPCFIFYAIIMALRINYGCEEYLVWYVRMFSTYFFAPLNIELLQKINVRPLDHLQLKIFLKQNIWLHSNIVEHIMYWCNIAKII